MREKNVREINLTKENICFANKISVEDNVIAAECTLLFDVDKYFGTETEDDEDVWINFYVFWSPDTDKYKALYTINSPDGNEEFAWDLTDEDIKVIKSAIEDYAKEEYEDISGLIEDYHNVIGE